VHPEDGKALIYYIRGDQPPKGAVNSNLWIDKKLGVFAQSQGPPCGYTIDTAHSAPQGPMRASGASPQHLDVLMLFFRAGSEAAAENGVERKGGAAGEDVSARLPKLCFVPTRLTIVGRYPSLDTSHVQRTAEGREMTGGFGEFVDMKIEWREDGLPVGLKMNSANARAARDGARKQNVAGNGAHAADVGEDEDCARERASGTYDHSWSQSVFVEGDAAPTYEQSLTSDLSAEMLDCWGSFKFDRSRSSCDLFDPSM
jgi:hypothetical protein